jgi:hypothetical protein
MLKRLYPPRRPQSVGEVLDTAFNILAASLFKTLPYGILLVLASQLVNIYNLATGYPLQYRLHDAQSVLVFLVGYLIQAPTGAAMILRQRAIALAEPYSMRAELRHGLLVVPQIAAVGLLFGLAFAVGLILLVLPGFYLLVALSLATPVLVLDGKGPIDALKLSLHLIRGNWWRTAGIYTITLVIAIVIYLIAAILLVVALQLIHGADVAITTAAARVLIIALGAVSFPYLTATALAVLGDLKVRDAAAADGRAEN